ncbi:unnamed protein product [Vitrella brassicaformis CCMP3155]|uniref:Uncharacterized protein n=1 Tax=Vitrella brassicaformis (strain CCMP3155) TaxID=1169540 RepID=A0A0G4FQ03_VITBC|nr:unnamed protein product [Vitrella brassicaformis CCMP3155]|eukprot:CEM15882.1 unnamed protein product [Vitrella brassicaformis CCMP3155]
MGAEKTEKTLRIKTVLCVEDESNRLSILLFQFQKKTEAGINGVLIFDPDLKEKQEYRVKAVFKKGYIPQAPTAQPPAEMEGGEGESTTKGALEVPLAPGVQPNTIDDVVLTPIGGKQQPFTVKKFSVSVSRLTISLQDNRIESGQRYSSRLVFKEGVRPPPPPEDVPGPPSQPTDTGKLRVTLPFTLDTSTVQGIALTPKDGTKKFTVTNFSVSVSRLTITLNDNRIESGQRYSSRLVFKPGRGPPPTEDVPGPPSQPTDTGKLRVTLPFTLDTSTVQGIALTPKDGTKKFTVTNIAYERKDGKLTAELKDGRISQSKQYALQLVYKQPTPPEARPPPPPKEDLGHHPVDSESPPVPLPPNFDIVDGEIVIKQPNPKVPPGDYDISLPPKPEVGKPAPPAEEDLGTHPIDPEKPDHLPLPPDLAERPPEDFDGFDIVDGEIVIKQPNPKVPPGDYDISLPPKPEVGKPAPPAEEDLGTHPIDPEKPDHLPLPPDLAERPPEDFDGITLEDKDTGDTIHLTRPDEFDVIDGEVVIKKPNDRLPPGDYDITIEVPPPEARPPPPPKEDLGHHPVDSESPRVPLPPNVAPEEVDEITLEDKEGHEIPLHRPQDFDIVDGEIVIKQPNMKVPPGDYDISLPPKPEVGKPAPPAEEEPAIKEARIRQIACLGVVSLSHGVRKEIPIEHWEEAKTLERKDIIAVTLEAVERKSTITLQREEYDIAGSPTVLLEVDAAATIMTTGFHSYVRSFAIRSDAIEDGKYEVYVEAYVPDPDRHTEGVSSRRQAAIALQKDAHSLIEAINKVLQEERGTIPPSEAVALEDTKRAAASCEETLRQARTLNTEPSAVRDTAAELKEGASNLIQLLKGREGTPAEHIVESAAINVEKSATNFIDLAAAIEAEGGDTQKAREELIQTLQGPIDVSVNKASFDEAVAGGTMNQHGLTDAVAKMSTAFDVLKSSVQQAAKADTSPTVAKLRLVSAAHGLKPAAESVVKAHGTSM